jgi:hypothetical protein
MPRIDVETGWSTGLAARPTTWSDTVGDIDMPDIDLPDFDPPW